MLYEVITEITPVDENLADPFHPRAQIGRGRPQPGLDPEIVAPFVITSYSIHYTKLYDFHMGFRGKGSRSTLADANAHRDWRIYADLAHTLIPVARKLYLNEDFGVELEQTVYALDATTIDLCLSVFPWAQFRQNKGAIKLHTVLDLRGNIPTFIHISDGKVHDVNVLDDLVPEAGAFYIMDVITSYSIHYTKLYDALHCVFGVFMNQPLPALIDTHAHLDHEQFATDRDEVIRRAQGNGISRILSVGCDLA